MKSNSEWINKSFKIAKCIMIASSTIIVPIVFVCALYESLPESASISDLLQTPSTYESILSGLMFGYSLPHLLFKTLPDAFKNYPTIIKNLYEKLIEPVKELTERDQKELELFLENMKTERSNNLEKEFINLQNDKEYAQLPAETKNRIAEIVALFKTDLQNTCVILQDTKKTLTELNGLNKKAYAICNKYTFLKDGYGDGVFSVLRLKDGSTIFAPSSSKEIYAMIGPDGSVKLAQDTQLVKNKTLKEVLCL